jgi:spore germination cell wall hydrolase CwlJ-like protein
VSKRRSPSRVALHSHTGWVKPAILAVGVLVGFPDAAARSDISALIMGQADSPEGWRNFIVASAAGSIHTEELVFNDPMATASIPAGRGIVLANGRRIALANSEKPVPATPDEDRVTRSLKKGRIVAQEFLQPPKDFTAGSILDRRASLLVPERLGEQKVAFAKPKLNGKEMEIAMSFHRFKPKAKDYGVPVEIASLVNNDKADSLATAYIDPTPDYAKISPFDSILRDTTKQRFVPDIEGKSHDWATNVLPASVFTEKEQKCLAEAIYFESITEPLKGQAAVAQVVLNRVRNPTFPNTICGVVYQNEDWRNRCQFSFACDRIPDIVWSKRKFKVAKEIALAVTAGKIYLKEVGDSTHYHATYVRPPWARTMKKVGKIGLHVFYRTYRGGWT